MEKVVVLCLLLVELSSSFTQETQIYFKEGNSLTLDLRPFPSKNITSILWTCNGDLLIDCCESMYYSTYKGTATLDMHTGRLMIKNMTKADEGVYSVEINNKVQGETYKAVMIKHVPKPEVRVSPLTARGPCKLTCEGDTTGAGPVTYSWKTGDGEWKELQKDIIEEEHGHVKTFTCRMKNPLSEEESPARTILFLPGKPADSGLWIKVLGAVIKSLAIFALLGAMVYALWRNQETLRKLMCPCQSKNSDYVNAA
ncbi:uncharacterized protein LOC117536482 [Gymnodraco acuticeps]|uniref:Uncharacterized protein LOC117536482 n=1 Tax=Gymnodraco acuticeps TaxID=8218 RepID=A0A6P8THW1_GYMAC|nr:uncharacterized protein LOC117536482 [Gymnodraco acuticeps]